MSPDDLVVLLDAQDRPCGSAPRSQVHHGNTPRHLAFSSYLFDERHRVLLTRRSLHKVAWPGVWTNSCCGHPRPGEDPAEAVGRRIGDELGVAVADLALVLPDFGYRAVDPSGVVENEFCPVWLGRISGELRVDPGESCDHAWVEWDELVRVSTVMPWLLSPWSVAQIPLLAQHLERTGAA